MEGRLLVKNCSLLEQESLRSHCAVVVDGTLVARVAPDAEEPVRPGDWAVDARGRLLLPGRVDGHARLAAAEAKRPLTDAEVEALSAARMAEALRAGVTTVLEHLSGVEHGASALAVQARTARQLGLRLVSSLAAQGIHAVSEHDVNVEHVRATAGDDLVHGGLGFANCLAATDELLRVVSRDAHALSAPVHLRLAESDSELAEHFEQHRTRMVERLDRHALLGPGTVAAHARAVDGAEAKLLAARSVMVAWSPLADLLGDVHGFDSVWRPEHRVALSTSAMGGFRDQWTAARILVHRAARLGRLWPSERLGDVLGEGPGAWVEAVFGRPAGRVAAGALADLILVDLVPGEGASVDALRVESMSAPVAWTVVNGRVVVREGQLLGTELLSLLDEASRVRRALA